MLGWEVYVYRQSGNSSPSEANKLLGRLETGVYGLRWLQDLVKEERAVFLGGNGYPLRYSIAAGILFSTITPSLPPNDSPLVIGDDYVRPEGWNGTVSLDDQGISDCPNDEILLIEAWDQS